jgi:hypothetical protein
MLTHEEVSLRERTPGERSYNEHLTHSRTASERVTARRRICILSRRYRHAVRESNFARTTVCDSSRLATWLRRVPPEGRRKTP